MYQFWTEPEMQKFMNRIKRLMKVGMNQNDADQLAERLLYRDRPGSGDDRRLCLECKHWRNKCLAPQVGYCTVPTMLQRCSGFMAVAA